MESRTDLTRFVSDANVFLHRARLPQAEFQRVFNGESALIALAHWAPEKIQTARELENEVTFFPGKLLALERRTGLRQRRVCEKGTRFIDLAMKAVDELIRKRTWNNKPIPFDEIDLIIYFGLGREYEEPAMAMLVQDRLGLAGQMAFDVSDACLGFIDAWSIADAMIATRRVRNALLVSAENGSVVTDGAIKIANMGGDILDQFASFTVGTGAVAAIVGPKSSNNRGINLKAGVRESYGEFHNLCVLKSLSEGIMRSDSKKLFEAGLSKFAPLTETILHYLDWRKDSVDMFIPHQVSMPATSQGANILGVPFPERFIMTFPEYGNMSSVSLPFSLSVGIDSLKEWKNQRILTIGFGSGLGVGVFGLETYGQ